MHIEAAIGENVLHGACFDHFESLDRLRDIAGRIWTLNNDTGRNPRPDGWRLNDCNERPAADPPEIIVLEQDTVAVYLD
jgi:hypothetical protein